MVKRRAMVIGIDTYRQDPLRNAVSDARKAATALERRGFGTNLLENADETTIKSALNDFSKQAHEAEIALVYLAGHAVERSGTKALNVRSSEALQTFLL